MTDWAGHRAGHQPLGSPEKPQDSIAAEGLPTCSNATNRTRESLMAPVGHLNNLGCHTYRSPMDHRFSRGSRFNIAKAIHTHGPR
jgi:hypothetical protein